MADLGYQELRLIGTVPLILALVLLGYAIARPQVGRALLSPSFDRFVTPPLLGVVYITGLALAVLGALYTVVRAVGWSLGVAVEMLIVAAAALVLYAVGFRVLVEVLVAVVRTAEATAAMSGQPLPGTVTATPAEAPEFCTECGAKRLDGTRFCQQCGQAFV